MTPDDREALAMDLSALDASMPVILGSGSTSTTISVHMLDRLHRALRLPVREDEPTGLDPYRLTEAMREVFDTTTRRRAVPYVEKIAAVYDRLTREASHVR